MSSFLESEMARKGMPVTQLSEMFIVRNVYQNKAQNYFLRQGKANFSEGALAHDLLNAAETHGLVPDTAYAGKGGLPGDYNHAEMAAVLQAVVETIVERKAPSPKWKQAFSAILDTYMGQAPEHFSVEGQTFTPKSFAQHLGYRADDYVSMSSFTHHPFGKPFVLEVPDNFSNGSFENVPIDEIVATIDRALDAGYSVAWDGDVSEPGFSADRGLAVLPIDPHNRSRFRKPVDEVVVTQEMRQATLENLETTDDHLMHLVGRVKDKTGKKYYIIKNSWGEIGPLKGHLYMSEAYVRLKTIAIIVHRDVATAGANREIQPASSDPAVPSVAPDANAPDAKPVAESHDETTPEPQATPTAVEI